MENKTRNIILLSITGVAAYLILRAKKANATTSANTNKVTPPKLITEEQEKEKQPIKLPDLVIEKPKPGRTTKDCRITYYSCTSGERHEMIEIPLNANCNDYQEVRPNCINEQLNKLFSDKKYTPQAQIDKGYL
jgi:hypothetical protein